MALLQVANSIYLTLVKPRNKLYCLGCLGGIILCFSNESKGTIISEYTTENMQPSKALFSLWWKHKPGCHKHRMFFFFPFFFLVLLKC